MRYLPAIALSLALTSVAHATCYRTTKNQEGPPPGCTGAPYVKQTYNNPADSGLIQDVTIYSFRFVEDTPPATHSEGPTFQETVRLMPGDSLYLWAAIGNRPQYQFFNGSWQVVSYTQGDNYSEMYVVSAQATYTPTKNVTFSVAPASYTYTGSPITPNVVPSLPDATFTSTGDTNETNVSWYSVTATGTGSFSGTATLDWRIVKADQTCSISPANATITAGQSVSFSASGTGWGDYTWSGANGSGTSASATFAAPGTYSVSVYRSGSSNYNQSPTATATITVVNPHTHSWVAYDNAGAWQTGSWSAWSPAWDVNTHYTDESKVQTRSRQDQRWHDRGQRCTANDADQDLGTDGWETTTVNDSQTLWGTQSRPSNQSGVWISPGFSSITTGDIVTFSAGGGDGTGAYAWGGQASGTGAAKAIRLSVAGTYYVTVYRAASSGWNASGSATAYIDVSDPNRAQSALSISPTNATVTVGQAITFTASGGNGTGEYRWGNSASGTGTSKTLTFASPGTYFVSVSRDASAGWLAAPSIFVSVTVTNPAPLNLHLATRAVPKPGMERWVSPSPVKTWTGSVQPVSLQ